MMRYVVFLYPVKQFNTYIANEIEWIVTYVGGYLVPSYLGRYQTSYLIIFSASNIRCGR